MESVESKAFRSLFSQLHTGITNSLHSVVMPAYSAGLISDEVKGVATSPLSDREQRTTEFLNAIQNRIKTEGSKAFETFLKILNDSDIAHKHLVTNLRDERAKERELRAIEREERARDQEERTKERERGLAARTWLNLGIGGAATRGAPVSRLSPSGERPTGLPRTFFSPNTGVSRLPSNRTHKRVKSLPFQHSPMDCDSYIDCDSPKSDATTDLHVPSADDVKITPATPSLTSKPQLVYSDDQQHLSVSGQNKRHVMPQRSCSTDSQNSQSSEEEDYVTASEQSPEGSLVGHPIQETVDPVKSATVSSTTGENVVSATNRRSMELADLLSKAKKELSQVKRKYKREIDDVKQTLQKESEKKMEYRKKLQETQHKLEKANHKIQDYERELDILLSQLEIHRTKSYAFDVMKRNQELEAELKILHDRLETVELHFNYYHQTEMTYEYEHTHYST